MKSLIIFTSLVVSYSSLGLGDVYPVGGIQLLVGVEVITGLILIGWTITYTFIVTERYLAHKKERHAGRHMARRHTDRHCKTNITC